MVLANSTGISVITSADVVIGGTVSGMGNLISGNGGIGIAVGSGSSNTLIAGNLIGTDITGTQALPNNFGIDVNNLAGTITIGTPDPAGRNLISGNNLGMTSTTASTAPTIRNNYFGTDITGTVPLPNNLAILLNTADTTDIVIGGTGPGEGNLIAFNDGAGSQHGIWSFGQRVTVPRQLDLRQRRSRVRHRRRRASTPNDPGTRTPAPTGGQNYPLISSVELTGPQGAGTRVQGFMRSTPSSTFTLDFYGNDGCTPRPQDFLEARTWLGEAEVTTDGVRLDRLRCHASCPHHAGRLRFGDRDRRDRKHLGVLPKAAVLDLPASGTPAGGTAITVTGSDFAAGAAVTIGGQPAGSINFVGPTQITATTPPLAAGTVHDLTVTNLDLTTGTLPKAWVSDFLDVPNFHLFYGFVTTLVRNAITAGNGGGQYGVVQPTLRQQMAVFLLKGKYGVCYVPPPCTGTFSDVPCPSTFADWIEDLADQGITGGCGTGVYCPQNPVRRDQMAVFLLKAKYGSGHVPPPCAGDLLGRPVPRGLRRLDRAARRRTDHGRLRHESAALLPLEQQHARADGGVPHEDLHSAISTVGPLGRFELPPRQTLACDSRSARRCLLPWVCLRWPTHREDVPAPMTRSHPKTALR